ncbi:hypothetical protein C8R47DRAFT_748566 [Mycena vitilis]|nr:hypothetical protein C8R47DRAFT_748566 [Mycena vitilis]
MTRRSECPRHWRDGVKWELTWMPDTRSRRLACVGALPLAYFGISVSARREICIAALTHDGRVPFTGSAGSMTIRREEALRRRSEDRKTGIPSIAEGGLDSAGRVWIDTRQCVYTPHAWIASSDSSAHGREEPRRSGFFDLLFRIFFFARERVQGCTRGVHGACVRGCPVPWAGH